LNSKKSKSHGRIKQDEGEKLPTKKLAELKSILREQR